MKAQKFLELVSEMMAAQKLYFKTRKVHDLISAKEVEDKVRAVLKVGSLEPDEPAEDEIREFVRDLNFYQPDASEE